MTMRKTSVSSPSLSVMNLLSAFTQGGRGDSGSPTHHSPHQGDLPLSVSPTSSSSSHVTHFVPPAVPVAVTLTGSNAGVFTSPRSGSAAAVNSIGTVNGNCANINGNVNSNLNVAKIHMSRSPAHSPSHCRTASSASPSHVHMIPTTPSSSSLTGTGTRCARSRSMSSVGSVTASSYSSASKSPSSSSYSGSENGSEYSENSAKSSSASSEAASPPLMGAPEQRTPVAAFSTTQSASGTSPRRRDESFPSDGGRSSITSSAGSACGSFTLGKTGSDTSGAITNHNRMKVFLKSMSPDVEQVRQCEEYFTRLRSFGSAPGGDAVATAVNKHLTSILAVHQSGEELASELQKIAFPGTLQYVLAEALSASRKKMYSACEDQKGILKSLISVYDQCCMTEAQLDGFRNQQVLFNSTLERCNQLREKFKSSFISKEDNVIDTAIFEASQKLRDCQEQCESQLEGLENALFSRCSKLQHYVTDVLLGFVRMEKSLCNITVATLEEIDPAYQRLLQKADTISLEHVLNDPECTEQFCTYVATAGQQTENLNFWIEAEKYRKTEDTANLLTIFQEIHNKYIDEHSPAPIKIPESVRQDLDNALAQKEVFIDSFYLAQEYSLCALRESVFNDFALRFLKEMVLEKRSPDVKKSVVSSLEDVVRNPVALEYFTKFLQVKPVESNSLRFWLEAELACNIRAVTEATTALNKDIYETYFPSDAPYYIPWHPKIRDDTREKVLCNMPAIYIFTVPKNIVLNMLKKTTFQQFLTSPLYQEYTELTDTHVRPRKSSPVYLSSKKRADIQVRKKGNDTRVDIVFKGTVYPEAFKKFLKAQKHPAQLHFECWNEIDKFTRNPSKHRAQEIFNKYLSTKSVMLIPAALKSTVESGLEGDKEPPATIFTSIQEKNVEEISSAFERFLKTSVYKDAKKERKKVTEQANKERSSCLKLHFR
ncbi:hypothetical protein Pelo_6434 [Pelomyxa schiedti]|nr:hypothetical protein Pelo_6434 [Pelomyxa schiedti]